MYLSITDKLTHFHSDWIYYFAIIIAFSPNLDINILFSGMSSQISAIGTILGTVIFSDEGIYPWSLKIYITGASFAAFYGFFAI